MSKAQRGKGREREEGRKRGDTKDGEVLEVVAVDEDAGLAEEAVLEVLALRVELVQEGVG